MSERGPSAKSINDFNVAWNVMYALGDTDSYPDTQFWAVLILLFCLETDISRGVE